MSRKKITQETFISRAQKIHNNKYCYKKTQYIGSTEKITITCPIHGDFLQKASNHVLGHGCPKCRRQHQCLSTNNFIEKSQRIHKNKYLYHKVIYEKSNIKVIITCRKHKDFLQTPNAHLCGYGCPKCGREAKARKAIKTTNYFIKKATIVHGQNYDYTKSIYKGRHTKIIITCRIHGDFKQSPNDHLNGAKCPKCSKIERSIKRTTAYKTFLSRACEIHNNFYDYSLVLPVKTHEFIKIICPLHGVFSQKQYRHLQGGGCPVCNKSKGELQIRNWLIKNNYIFIPQHKFDDCKNLSNTHKLKFDFFLPKDNIIIEFDGIQHFQPVQFNGCSITSAKENFIKTKRHDKIKNNYCKNNNFRIIRIKYLQLAKIDKILDQMLSR